jgi:exodeoxyribonuclease VII large subunit
MKDVTLTLYELNGLVREVIEDSLDKAYWVEAELSEVREVRGHCYMGLVQKDLFGNTPIAYASAKCWKNKWMKLRPYIERTTGQALHVGMKVRLHVTANFHEAYGFSWIVEDIDPTFTMGDLARRRQEIIRTLKENGIFDLQKELSLPLFTQHIAVISSASAAGYGDFCNQLADNEEGLAFHTELFVATMQGEEVESSIIRALDKIYQRLDEFDVVVIIRGGGATADMSGFDTLALAENVANFPIPIITGIGHDRDECVLDMISCIRVKTPTAAATFLVDHLAEVYHRLENAQATIVNDVVRRLDYENMRLGRLSEKIPILFSVQKVQQNARLHQLYTSLIKEIQRRLTEDQHRLSILSGNLQPLVERKLLKEQHRISLLDVRLDVLNPQKLLKRGYSITTYKGKTVRDAAMLKVGDEIETRIEKGKLKSIIK